MDSFLVFCRSSLTHCLFKRVNVEVVFFLLHPIVRQGVLHGDSLIFIQRKHLIEQVFKLLVDQVLLIICSYPPEQVGSWRLPAEGCVGANIFGLVPRVGSHF